MIYVTQGHEKGIGLEIFLKSFLLLPPTQKKEIVLIANESDFKQNIRDLRIPALFLKDLKVIFPPETNLFSSTSTLLHALGLIGPNDILVTLPTSKDQLVLEGKNMAGYTEFFRHFYKNPYIAMTFKGSEHNTLLITDHIPVKDVPLKINRETIVKKTSAVLDCYKKYFFTFDEVYFSGINPHAGENGILGTEDSVVGEAIKELRKHRPEKFHGPLSGDTLHVYEREDVKQLFVYMFHDQGLAKFKSHYGLIGLNISAGLPFLRLSVDHGTAFELYGTHRANISGMMFLLKQAFEVKDYVCQ